MVPARTCLGCRRRDERSALLRMVARDGVVIPDPSASLPGRGAWVHRDRECVESAVKRRAFGRALRVAGEMDATAVLAAVGTDPTGQEEQADPPMDH